ncbi:MAG: NUDIX hydrolase [Thermoanaerobaculia bacterium]|jgi:8-oxo-dGTP pyrophosphatase MutT (NUDIX family)
MNPNTSELLDLLTGFVPATDDERRHVESLHALLLSAASPFSRLHFEPGHVTASAFVVDPEGSRLLLHHHRRLDRWLQMGGHVDSGESVIDAALREAREESGLEAIALPARAPFDIDVHAIPAGKGEPPHLHFDVRFIVRAANPASIRIAPAESNDLRWFELDEAIDAMKSPESRRAIEKIRRAANSRP